MLKLINEQRENTSKPNIWSTMNTVQLQVTLDLIPAGGEVHLIDSFNPAFWKTQPKTNYRV
mgnify:CR=1 FL=1